MSAGNVALLLSCLQNSGALGADFEQVIDSVICSVVLLANWTLVFSISGALVTLGLPFIILMQWLLALNKLLFR